MYMTELLHKLCDINGVSGFEKNIALFICEKIKDSCDSLYISTLGNVVAFKKGAKSPSKKVMYCAHMDEVGLMIRYINEDGTLLFEDVGIMPEVLPSKRVLIGENKIPGIICSKPVHLIKDNTNNISTEDMYIDIGTYSKEESEKLGVYAQYAAFENDFTVFGNGTMIRSKALDDRIGCAVMIDMINSCLEYDSYFVFTVGEELGGLGATQAVREVNPDVAVIFESTTASDIPCSAGGERVCALGDGPVVPFMDGGTLYDKELYKKIRTLAEKENIKTQTKTKIAGGTDAAYIQRSMSGVRVCAVSTACRYIHTSSCVCSILDISDVLKLAHSIDKNLESII